MCGFAGLIHPRPDSDADALRAEIAPMSRAVAHRGPDGEGVFVDPAAGIALGHRRLAIHDLTDAGRQPMASPCGRWILAFNGEVYNFRALRGDLARDGWAFRSETDTEVLLAAICCWGIRRALERCRGMLAMAVWDRRDRRLVLARDRLGKKPLYVGWAGDTFVFGSELHALAAHHVFRRELDPTAVALYFRYGYVPAPHAIYRRSRKLEPATVLTVRPDDLASLRSDFIGIEERTTHYWSAPAVTAGRVSDPDEVRCRATALLQESVAERLEADVPVGVFLSGGVDSTTVAAVARDCSPTPVTTISLGFEESGFDESDHAARIAERLGTHHLALTATQEEALEVVPGLAGHQDEPFADSSQIALMMVSALARRHVTVVLTGDGGDEVFGGYNRHIRLPGIWTLAERLPGWARTALAHGASASSILPWHAVPSTALRIPHVGDKLDTLSRVLAAGSRERAYDAAASIWPAPPFAPGGMRLETVVRRPSIAGADFSAWMMRCDLTGYLPDDLMVKVDRATMAHGLEARSPLLDHRLIEHVWAHGDVFHPHPRVGKRFLVELAGRSVPRAWLQRAKTGFSVPIGQWLRGPLKSWGDDLLRDAQDTDRDWLDGSTIHRLWRRHLAGAPRHTHRLWAVLQVLQWCRRHAAHWPREETHGPLRSVS
jgi:asparagine synthase (glutamine-hydrolysing)